MKTFQFLIFTLAVALGPRSVIGRTDSIAYYIKKLGWNSFEEVPAFVPKVVIFQSLERVITIEDSGKLKLLFDKLADPEYTVAAHIALSRIIEPDNNQFAALAAKKPGTLTFIFNGIKLYRTDRSKGKPLGKIGEDKIWIARMYWRRK